ncbi:MAG: hypothetical protein HY369_01670 [Candidatus Aenigmarchaeota archaeon]|nr:hypothetical protein [Candidatus Aenigmarchaeota archaeon]
MGSTAAAKARIVQLLDVVDPVRMRLLVRMAEAFATELQSTVNSQAGLLTPNLAAALGAQLLLHHATHDEKLNKKTFEYILKYACEAAGLTVTINPNPTNSAEDVNIAGVRYSLKTQADSNITRRAAYIQKLMEARWIRDHSDRDALAKAARTRIMAHLSNYERMLMLRAFDEGGTAYRYELLEIPLAVLRLVGDLPNSAFSEKNRYGSSGAVVQDERGTAFRLLLDGSVEKVRVFNLRTDRCVLHAEWVIPRRVYSGGAVEQ